MKYCPSRSGNIAARSLTPLLDTLFILLFALLAVSETRSSTQPDLIYVRLPSVEASPQVGPSPGGRLVLVIDAGSRVHLAETGEVLANGFELDRALAAVLGDALPEDIAIEIQGDRDARHGVVVALLQHLRLRGFYEISLVAIGGESDRDAFGVEP